MEHLEEISLLRDAGAVKRYHTQRTLREQTLATHSFGVMQLILHVDPEASGNLLRAAMFHDLPEYLTGDIPAPIKRNSPRLAVMLEEIEAGAGILAPRWDLDQRETCLLKWADTMELLLFSLEELAMGNQYSALCIKHGIQWIAEYPTTTRDDWRGYPVAKATYEQARDYAYRLGIKEEVK